MESGSMNRIANDRQQEVDSWLGYREDWLTVRREKPSLAQGVNNNNMYSGEQRAGLERACGST